MPRVKSTPKQECLSLFFLAIILAAGIVATAIDFIYSEKNNER